MSEFDTDDSLADITEDIDPASIPVVIDANIWKSLMEGLASLERHIADTNEDTPNDALAELRNCVLFMQQRVAAIRQRIDQKFMEAIQAHGPIEIGDIRYVVGIERTTRCVDTVATTECLLEATAGGSDSILPTIGRPAVQAGVGSGHYRGRQLPAMLRDGISEER